MTTSGAGGFDGRLGTQEAGPALAFAETRRPRLIALARSQPPEGQDRWTLKLLAERLVALEVVDSISDQTVRRTLKETNCSRIGRRVG
jgi:hypothetical protein